MHILNYNQFIETQHCHEEFWGFGGEYSSSPMPATKPPVKASTSGKVTTLKEGFGEHAMKLPNGCTITTNDKGEVFLSEKDGAPKKIRNKDSVQNMLVK